MKKNRKPESFIRQPSYPGGRQALDKLISENLQYPQEAVEAKVEGTVRVKFDIDYKGKVIRTKVIEGIGYGCDEEAERLVRMLKFDVPKHKGVRITFHKDLNIHFRLPRAKPASGFSFSYEYVPSKK